MSTMRADERGKQGAKRAQHSLPNPHKLGCLMANPIARAARWCAYAAASLANGEAAKDEKTRQVHLDIAKHFLSMAEQEIDEVKERVKREPNAVAFSNHNDQQ